MLTFPLRMPNTQSSLSRQQEHYQQSLCCLITPVTFHAGHQVYIKDLSHEGPEVLWLLCSSLHSCVDSHLFYFLPQKRITAWPPAGIPRDCQQGPTDSNGKGCLVGELLQFSNVTEDIGYGCWWGTWNQESRV